MPVQTVELEPPSLDDLAKAITASLAKNFKISSVEVEECRDLRLPPFYLAGTGLSGHRRIADVGGQANLAPVPNLSKKYDIHSVSRLMDMPNGGFLIGAGAGPFHILGVNSELMPNIQLGADTRNLTYYAKVTDEGAICCEPVAQDNTHFGLMANFYASEGLTGPSIHIKASGRTGEMNFTNSIQKALRDAFGDKLISVGGVFVVSRGKCNLHVMPDFPSEPFRDRTMWNSGCDISRLMRPLSA